MPDDYKSPEQIERDIERERAELGDTLDQLQDRFSVETIARQTSDYVREHGGEVGRAVSDAVKANPLALTLTGVGIAWLIFGKKSTSDGARYETSAPRSDHNVTHKRAVRQAEGFVYPDDRLDQEGYDDNHYRSYRSAQRDLPSWMDTDDENDGRSWSDNAEDTARKVKDAAKSVKDGSARAAASARDSAGDAADNMSNRIASLGQKLRDTATSAKDRARYQSELATLKADRLRARVAEGTEDMTEKARQRVIAARYRALEARNQAARHVRNGADQAVDMYQQQPLIAGALALAVGAAIAAAVPRTRTEDAYLGEHSDALVSEAERIFAEEREKLKTVAKAAKDEVKSIAEETKDAADDAAPERKNAAQAAASSAKSATARVVGAVKSEADEQDLGKPNT
ncbi:DUF3618 domain-containing protein [uncultured Roseobacter sp.]|uniref:DUF3618 domain-containing protein n=1 Tax=uncultured Roseobacter sp. TaxID=114847 RepID=UPI0026266FB4|nr:DUF3618 domain-containing protein [uncultured Roseobacter sp.]